MKLRLSIVAAAACAVLLLIASPAVAARAALVPNPAIGPPTTLTKAKGSGFSAGRSWPRTSAGPGSGLTYLAASSTSTRHIDVAA